MYFSGRPARGSLQDDPQPDRGTHYAVKVNSGDRPACLRINVDTIRGVDALEIHHIRSAYLGAIVGVHFKHATSVWSGTRRVHLDCDIREVVCVHIPG